MSKTTATELSVGELEARIELSVGELKALASALYEHVMLGCPTWSKPSPPADAKEEANRALMSAYGKIWELDWIEENQGYHYPSSCDCSEPKPKYCRRGKDKQELYDREEP